MALGYELKGLLLNYALASRQRAELSAAKDKEALVEKNLVVLEKDIETAKARCEGELKSLKEKHAKDVADLEERYKGDLSEAKKDKEAAVKAMNDAQAIINSKDERIKALSQENEVALAELKSLKEEKAGWISQKDALEIQAGEQYDEGFAFALEQVKILFPDLDPALLSQADVMALVEDGKLIPYVPSQPTPDSTAKESPTAVEDPPADA
jgi:predicted nuclease with TOPRIM domain